MARKIVFVDDLTGEEIPDEDGGPIQFSLGEEFFEMDLGSKSLAKLTKALQPFMDKAMSVEPPEPEPVRSPRSATTKRTKFPGEGKDYLDAVRRWARGNGYEVADRGRIAGSVKEAYEAAKTK
jgi:nucleoid-associated protein Lsr2